MKYQRKCWNYKIWDGWWPSHSMFLEPSERFQIILNTQCFETGCKIRNILCLCLYEDIVHQQFLFRSSFTFGTLLMRALNSQMLYQTAFTTEGNVIPPTHVMEVLMNDNLMASSGVWFAFWYISVMSANCMKIVYIFVLFTTRLNIQKCC